jgi:HEPN domain-containing protein
MIDTNKQITYWQESAKEDWEVALELVSNNRSRHGLFFAHLALEKILKALVCKETNELAPKIHNLIRLAELAKINLPTEQFNLLTDMNPFNLEGRYSDSLNTPPTKEETQAFMNRTEEVFIWLMSQL